MALLLLAVLPAVLLAAYAMVDARQSAVLDAQEKSAYAADSLGTYAERPITQARQVLSAVAVAPVVRHGNPEEISDFLADVHAENPEFSSLLVTGPEGRVIAGSVALTSLPDLSDRDYVRQVQETHAFSVGSYSVGRATGKPILTMGQPILAEDGSLLGVVVTGIELEVFGSFADSADLPDGASFSVVDRNGTVLTRHPDPQSWIGKTVEGSALGEPMLAGASGSSELSGPDGVTRLYSYAPVPGAEGAMFVAVGVPRSVAYASASTVVLQFAVGMAIVMLLVSLAAWLGADVLVLRPIRRLVTVALGLGSGDLSVRVGADGGSGEIGQLARAFDSMAETIEERTEALAEAESRYRSLVESSPNGVVVHSAGRILFANPAAARIVGAAGPDGLVGRSPLEFVHPDSKDSALSRIGEAFRTGEATPLAEETFLRLDGTTVEVEVVGIPMTFGATVAMNTLIRDVSARKRAELAAQEGRERGESSQRLEAIGRLAGGIAHDFNNLLTAIVGHTALLQQGRDASSEDQKSLLEIRKSAERASALTRQLLAFSRRQTMQPRIFSLNEVTTSMSGLLERLIGENVILRFQHDPELCPIQADPGQIEQVIMNLAINARDAMPDGGKLTIETANVDLDATYVSSHFGAQPGPHVLLAVTDTGTGIDPEILPHVFEPFFTTKTRDQGTGLGLSTVYGIVKQNEGSIWVYSEVGEGTTFKVYFPRADRPVDWAPEAPSAGLQPSVGGSETILVVEDEPLVRALVVRILEGGGYVVLQEGSPVDALALFDDHGGVVHLLLTDVVLPGMSGQTLAETVTARQGVSPKVLFMSGYTQNAIVHNGRLEAGVNFLEKPFTPDGLLRKIREVLDRPQEGQLEMDV
ncbi:MAG: ATP-binding protein [Chloroflexota bacterium]